MHWCTIHSALFYIYIQYILMTRNQSEIYYCICSNCDNLGFFTEIKIIFGTVYGNISHIFVCYLLRNCCMRIFMFNSGLLELSLDICTAYSASILFIPYYTELFLNCAIMNVLFVHLDYVASAHLLLYYSI